MGSSSKKESDDINDSGVNEYKELSYKLFQLRDYKVKGPNGEYRCPFCACKDEPDCHYTNLLQHAIKVAEGSISGKQRAKHSAMARYLAIDLADQLSWSEDEMPLGRKRSKPGENSTPKNNARSKAVRAPPTRKPRVNGNVQKLAMAEKREKEALDKIRELERKVNELSDQMNALITKERLSNDELQGVRTELIKGLSDIQRSSKYGIGIKRIGELNPQVFIEELENRILPGESTVKGVELCTLWQEKIKDPQWYPFQIIEDNKGKPERLLKEDDITLQALKEEWGEEIHDAVVEAMTDLQEHNPSGCYMVPELWHFGAQRKAVLDEVIRHVFQLHPVKAQPRKSSKG